MRRHPQSGARRNAGLLLSVFSDTDPQDIPVGSPEPALISAGAAQLARHYRLPSYIAAPRQTAS